MPTIYHDEYAAWMGQCNCPACHPMPTQEDDDRDERDEALEWHGVDL
jgi:hypothetical protein